MLYVGFERLNDLFPGANPAQVNDGAGALVRVSEITSEFTAVTVLVVSGVSASSETQIPASTSTTIKWLIYGLETVEFRMISGTYMDAIMAESVFDDGGEIAGTRSLNVITGGLYSVIEQLAGGTGNAGIADASEVVVDGQIPLLGDGSGAQSPDAWWSRSNDAVGDEWYLSSDFGALLFASQGARVSSEGAGWVYL